MTGLSNEELVADGLLTILEAQAFTRLSRSDLYARMERGEIEYCKIGRRRLIPRRSCVELARANLVVRSSKAMD